MILELGKLSVILNTRNNNRSRNLRSAVWLVMAFVMVKCLPRLAGEEWVGGWGMVAKDLSDNL